MQRSNIFNYILITLLILMVFGVISFGDVLNVAFYIIMGIILLAVIGSLLFRLYLRRLSRKMQDGGAQGNYRTYSWGSSDSQRNAKGQGKQEGEVTIQRTNSSRTKVVNNEVGSYAEYEEIDEETTSEKR